MTLEEVCCGRVVLVLIIANSFVSGDLKGQCVSSNRSEGAHVGYDVVQLVPNGVPAGLMDEFRRGYGNWNASSCNGGSTDDNFPGFSESFGGRVITLSFRTGFNPSNDESCGNFSGNTVSLYEFARRPNGSSYNCNRSDIFEDTVTHELGHVLGLKDQSASCSGFIMSQVGFTPSGSYVNRSIRPAECQLAASTNVTPNEDLEEECERDPTNCPQCDPQKPGCGSPIVIDLDDRGFLFSDLRHGVHFDIDADGFLERTPWILPRSRDAFLAYDRNQNGSIDDGSELFGDATPFLNGTTTARNGYQALFELDIVSGNGNGYIDREDGIFDKLLLWRDRNTNGIAERTELSTLRENGVVALATEYRVSTRRDAHSNELRFVSYAWIEQRGTRELKRVETVDVVFPFEELVE